MATIAYGVRRWLPAVGSTSGWEMLMRWCGQASFGPGDRETDDYCFVSALPGLLWIGVAAPLVVSLFWWYLSACAGVVSEARSTT
jgi:hypothetical protein